MKNTFVIAMLLSLGFSQIGYYLFSIAYETYLKEEMKEFVLSKIDKKNLTVISYSDNIDEIKWENNREFSFKNEMYDVIKRDTINKKIFLYCIDDKKETSLIAKYNEATKHQNSGKKNKGVEKSNTIFCEVFKAFTYPQVNVAVTKMLYASTLQNTYVNITTPPPKYFI